MFCIFKLHPRHLFCSINQHEREVVFVLHQSNQSIYSRNFNMLMAVMISCKCNRIVYSQRLRVARTVSLNDRLPHITHRAVNNHAEFIRLNNIKFSLQIAVCNQCRNYGRVINSLHPFNWLSFGDKDQFSERRNEMGHPCARFLRWTENITELWWFTNHI